MSLLQNYLVWIHGLPPLAQPFAQSFFPCLLVLTAFMIWRRIRLYRRGQVPAVRKFKPLEYAVMAAAVVGLLYAWETYPAVRRLTDWPDKAFPLWREHSPEVMVSFLAAGYLAMYTSKFFAALFLRQPAGRSGSGVPAFPPGWEGWARERTYRSEWEDE